MGDCRIPEETAVGWVELRVADLDRALCFYHEIVGVQPPGD
ncbi:MAG TPA: hypothetical protein VGJ97_13685 [Anaerolineaceae bacterium]